MRVFACTLTYQYIHAYTHTYMHAQRHSHTSYRTSTHTHIHAHKQGEQSRAIFAETGTDPGAGEFVRRVKGELALIAEKEKARLEGERAIEAAVRALELHNDVNRAKEQVCGLCIELLVVLSL